MNKRIVSGGGLILAIALFVGINILSNQLLTSWRLDLTENKLFTLSKGTRNILDKLDEPITLRYYFSEKTLAVNPQFLNYGVRVRDLLQEYAAKSHGKIKLTVIDPEPFSEAEDQAVTYGIRQLPVNSSGDMAYFGLAGTNTTDDELTIPFFQPAKESALEYDITKLVYNLAHPKKRVIGVITELPIFGGAANPTAGQRGAPPWTIVSMLKDAYNVRQLSAKTDHIDTDIDTLLVIHPKSLPDPTRYAIDQFILKGGKAMIFVDPFAEADQAMPDPTNPMVMPQHSSDMPKLFKAWGLEMVPNKIAADMDSAIRVYANGARGPQQVEYLPWLGLTKKNLNQEDFVTSQLKQIYGGTMGILHKVKGATTRITPLIHTGKQSEELDAESIMFARDPNAMLQDFKPSGEEYTLAVRVHGMVKTAFPDGRPKKKEGDPADPDFVKASKSAINVIVVGDTDILSDRFWVRAQNFMGVSVPSPIADNGDFVINAVDNLGGNDDLISLRSRQKFARPFTVVERIRKQAEAQFRDKEKTLEDKLKATEKKIHELQDQKAQGAAAQLLSPAQQKAIEKFRQEQVETRKELRAVQRDLRKNIESLGTELRIINIGLIPALMGIIALLVALLRAGRRRRPMS